MKRITKLLLCLLALMLCMTCTVCAFADGEGTTTTCTHPNATETITKEATCTEDGIKESYCTNCKVTSTELIKAPGHTPSETDIYTCSVCSGTITHSPSEGGSVCTVCGVTLTSGDDDTTCTEHDFSKYLPLSSYYHSAVCKYCDEPDPSPIPILHTIYCTAPTTCIDCGATDITGDPNHDIDGNKWESDATNCWNVCLDCGKQAYLQSHKPDCQTGACWRCGRTDIDGEIQHTFNNSSVWEHDENQHWIDCATCGTPAQVESHFVSCNDSTNTCYTCMRTGLTIEKTHNLDFSTLHSDENQHWYACLWCSNPGTKFNHTYTNGVCTCGKTEPVGCSHNFVSTSTAATCTTPGVTQTVCSKCGEVQSSSSTPALGHSTTTSSTTGNCTAPSQETTSCTRCGAVISSSSIPALGHAYSTVTTKAATCSEDGLMETVCSRCGDVAASEVIPQLSHDRWFTVPSVATCTSAGTRVWYCHNCGLNLGSESIPAKGHALSTTDNGDAIVESCSRCDYEKVTVKATPTPEPTATPAPTAAPTVAPTVVPTSEPTAEPTAAPVELPEDAVVTPMEDVVIEIETETAPETETETEVEDEAEVEVKPVQITVSEVALEVTTVVLPLSAEVKPAKVITVQMTIPEVTEEEKVAIPQKVKVALPVTEEEAAALANTKLVLVLSDGSMIELPYEVVDGKLVFTTTQMGVFAFIPVE